MVAVDFQETNHPKQLKIGLHSGKGKYFGFWCFEWKPPDLRVVHLELTAIRSGRFGILFSMALEILDYQ